MHYHASMQCRIDEQVVEIEANQLGQVLAAAQGHLQDQGRVVVEVLVNNESLVGDQIAERQHESVDGLDIQLISSSPKELSIETLDQVDQRLQESVEIQTEAANLLRADRGKEALEQVSQIIDTWLKVQQAVLQCCQLVNVDFSELRADGFTATELTERLLGQLQELKSLIESADYSALADVLEHEWPDVVSQWRDVIRQLTTTIRER